MSHVSKFMGTVAVISDPRVIRYDVLPGGDFMVTATKEDAEALIPMHGFAVEVPPQKLEDGYWLTVFSFPPQLQLEDASGHKR